MKKKIFEKTLIPKEKAAKGLPMAHKKFYAKTGKCRKTIRQFNFFYDLIQINKCISK